MTEDFANELAVRASSPESSTLPGEPAPFASDDAMIESALKVFNMRARQNQNISRRFEREDSLVPEKIQDRWRAWWHRCLALTTDPSVVLAETVHRHQLSVIEAEIITALTIDRLGLSNCDELPKCKNLLAFLGGGRMEGMNILRALGEDGRLCRLELIAHDDMDQDLCEREFLIDPRLVDKVLRGNQKIRTGLWPAGSESDLLKQLTTLTAALKKRSDTIEHSALYGSSRLPILNHRIDRLYEGFVATLKAHPDWKLNALFKTTPPLTECMQLIVLILVGRDMGHYPIDDELFTGLGLARAVSIRPGDVEQQVWLLNPNSRLVRERFIQPYVGNDPLITDDDDDAGSCDYELTDEMRALLGIEKRMVRDRFGQFHVRRARFGMDHLVLNGRVRAALSMAAAQVRHAYILLSDWGLGESIPYGRAVTLLFSGPPGTGKTACAEALAHELDMPLLVADYSQILNCFVGNTEKSLARVFRDARAHRALLFWDEADSMFYNRSMAFRSWEIQQANVLLTELEKFEGVCILATNRKISLDPALERRISLKIEFDRPDEAEREQIWQRLIPEKLPVGADVDIAALSRHDLSGGEIKNAVLNAARLALTRGSAGPLTNADFSEAIRLERDGRLRSDNRPKIGFANQ